MTKVENRQSELPPIYLAHPLGVIMLEFHLDVWCRNTSVHGRLNALSHFDTILAVTYKQTDTDTRQQHIQHYA